MSYCTMPPPISLVTWMWLGGVTGSPGWHFLLQSWRRSSVCRRGCPDNAEPTPALPSMDGLLLYIMDINGLSSWLTKPTKVTIYGQVDILLQLKEIHKRSTLGLHIQYKLWLFMDKLTCGARHQNRFYCNSKKGLGAYSMYTVKFLSFLSFY